METARILAALALVLALLLVLFRVILLRRKGTEAMKFGAIDKKDFLIPPFALFYFYLVLAAAFRLPSVAHEALFRSQTISWLGVLACFAGVALLLWSLVSFGRSFRVGIDPDRPDQLITAGIFAFSRNPIYVAFALVLIGEFLAFPHPILLIYLIAAVALFHRQVLREERFLAGYYGERYRSYQQRVRRYL